MEMAELADKINRGLALLCEEMTFWSCFDVFKFKKLKMEGKTRKPRSGRHNRKKSVDFLDNMTKAKTFEVPWTIRTTVKD